MNRLFVKINAVDRSTRLNKWSNLFTYLTIVFNFLGTPLTEKLESVGIVEGKEQTMEEIPMMTVERMHLGPEEIRASAHNGAATMSVKVLA